MEGGQAQLVIAHDTSKKKSDLGITAIPNTPSLLHKLSSRFILFKSNLKLAQYCFQETLSIPDLIRKIILTSKPYICGERFLFPKSQIKNHTIC